MSLRRPIPRDQTALLPNWIFDVDETDEALSSDQPILQELEIDIHQIQKTCIYILSHTPLVVQAYFSGRASTIPITLHPLTDNQEFWGPCAVVSVYVWTLWFGRVRNVPWIFLIWIAFSFFTHLVARVSFKSSYALHISVLGYSILPIIPFTILILVFRPPVWLASSLQILSVVWASMAAYMSYQDLVIEKITHSDSTSNLTSVNRMNADKNGILLLCIPVVLMEMYVTTFLPIQ